MNEHLEYGICRLCLVGVRSEPSDYKPLVTQLLFGEHYYVKGYDPDQQWLEVQQYADGTHGWIRADQHFPISDAYFNQINAADYKVSLDIVSSLLFRKNNIYILLGSVLPISSTELFKMEEQLAFNGESKSLSQKRDGEYFVSIVKKYIGAPYLLGGKSPMGIDDGGLIQQSLKICGYKVHRYIGEQEKQGELVQSFEEMQAGDVIFYQHDHAVKMMVWLDNNEVVRLAGYVQKEKFEQSEVPFVKSIRRYIKV